MDGNKDEALKCLKIGKQALNSGDIPRARKFICKAQRLDPALHIDDLLSILENSEDRYRSSPISDSPKTPEQQSNLRNRSNRAPSSAAIRYTEEQITIVRQINKTKNYYDILNLDNSCSVEDVRKAYLKLSLKVHPDKNQAPGAEDAFKAVSKAFQCLSNENSRKKYDVCGSEEIVFQTHSTARSYQYGGEVFNNYYEEVDPDEIFRQFFPGGAHHTSNDATYSSFNNDARYSSFNNDARYSSFNRDASSREQKVSGFRMRVIQLLPILIFVMFQLFPASEPIYSLSRNYPYEERLSTVRGVNYYVKSSTTYNENYPANSKRRLKMEAKVERDYTEVLAHNCRFENQRKQWGYVSETPHCEMLRRFEPA